MLLSRKERSISLDFLPGWPKPPRPYTGPSRGVRGAYFAALRSHFARSLSDEERHALNGAIVGKKHGLSTRSWSREQWSWWMDRFAAHCVRCPGGEECSALAQVRETVKC